MQAPVTFLINITRLEFHGRKELHPMDTWEQQKLQTNWLEAARRQWVVSSPSPFLPTTCKTENIWKQEQENWACTLDNAPSEFNCNLMVMVISINLIRLEDYLVCRLCFLVCIFSASVLHRALTFWMCVLSLPFCLIWRRDPLHMFLTI